jgi:serine phosphatase RsbU (regulator of sigma subunit)
MKKRKTFKSKIIEYYLWLAIFISIFVIVLNTILALQKLKEQKSNSTALIERSFEQSIKQATKSHQEYIKNMITAEARNIADILEIGVKDYKLDKFDKKGLYTLLGTVTNRKNNIYDIAILNKDGDIVFDRRNSLIGKNYKMFKTTDPVLYAYTKKALTMKESFRIYNNDQSPTNQSYQKYSVSIRVHETPFFLFSDHYENSFYKKLALTLAGEKEKNKNIMINQLDHLFWKSLIRSIIMLSLIMAIFIFATYWIGKKLAHWISSPLEQVQKCLQNYSEGQFRAKIHELGSVETASIINAFNKLGKDLNVYMSKLENEITTRNILENEIRIAHNIQEAILPHFSDEYNNESFSLFAKLVPAKDVAGDFYDYFYLNKEKTKLAFLIGDVSGKGISAAFFMCIVKTFIRSLCLSGSGYHKPQNILEQTNKYICENNAEYMFVTLFLGYYDIATGDFNYANAGHHPTIQLTKNNQIKDFGLLNNAVLGFYPEHEYFTGHINIKHGEKLVLYTDGITEAVSPEQKEYGIEHLNKILSENITASPKNICIIVIENVSKFQKNTLFDDITILVFHRK